MELIGFVGVGTIGGVIARNLLRAGYAVMVHDIRTEAVEALVEAGAQSAGSPAEVGRGCDVTFTSLPGPPEVEEVALGSAGLVRGVRKSSLYVDLSSSSPQLIRRIAAEFHLRGARFMEYFGYEAGVMLARA